MQARSCCIADDWQDDETADVVQRPASVRSTKRYLPELEKLLAEKSRNELQALLIELADDDGMTATAISACLEIVLRALPQTALTPVEQLLWLAERELEDQYDLLGDTDKILNDWRYTPLHWRKVSVVMEGWLKQLPIPQKSSFSTSYQRKRVVLWLRDTYARSEESHKIIPLLEQEAAADGGVGRIGGEQKTG